MITRNKEGKYVVVLDPGHGGYDPGAVKNGLVEKTINLVQANACKKELQKCKDITVIMTREDDRFIEIYDRCVFAKSVNATMLISFHNNGGGGDRFEAIHSIHKDDLSVGIAKYINNRVLEDKVQSVGKLLSRASKTAPSLDHFGIVRFSRQFGFPGVILEGFFIDNEIDSKDFDEVYEQENYGKNIAKYIMEFLDVCKEETEKKEVPMWKKDIIKEALQLGLIKDNKWLDKPDESATVWFVLLVVINAIKTMKDWRK